MSDLFIVISNVSERPNGSDSRFYIMELHVTAGTTPFLVIGTDDAFLENPVATDQLIIAPCERYDVVIDFSQLNGQPP